MKPDSIIFDLDGTLWDATSVTAEAWRILLSEKPEITPAVIPDSKTVKQFMGVTNEKLAEILFPTLPFEKAFSYIAESCVYENKILSCRGGILYPDCQKTLGLLISLGLTLHIVSNCQDGYIEAFLERHEMSVFFSSHLSSGKTGRGKAENISAIIEQNKLKSPVYVGDTFSDRDGAAGAGIPFIYAKYGFGEECGWGKVDDYAYSIEALSDLPALIEKL